MAYTMQTTVSGEHLGGAVAAAYETKLTYLQLGEELGAFTVRNRLQQAFHSWRNRANIRDAVRRHEAAERMLSQHVHTVLNGDSEAFYEALDYEQTHGEYGPASLLDKSPVEMAHDLLEGHAVLQETNLPVTQDMLADASRAPHGVS